MKLPPPYAMMTSVANSPGVCQYELAVHQLPISMRTFWQEGPMPIRSRPHWIRKRCIFIYEGDDIGAPEAKAGDAGEVVVGSCALHRTRASVVTSVNDGRVAVYLADCLHDRPGVCPLIVVATRGIAACSTPAISWLVQDEQRRSLGDVGCDFSPDVAALRIPVGKDQDRPRCGACRITEDAWFSVMNTQAGATSGVDECVGEQIGISIVAFQAVGSKCLVVGSAVLRRRYIDIRAFICKADREGDLER